MNIFLISVWMETPYPFENHLFLIFSEEPKKDLTKGDSIDYTLKRVL